MPEALKDFPALLVAWQRQHGRSSLPWQNTRDPYRVWLSEIMLQQTQVTTVLGYYARFLERFPTVTALADAHLDEVLAMWQGLGYYSRARNLHRCAEAVRDRHGGEFPRGAAALKELPGIGRSTAAAIAAFCFGERVAILDGNVKRVLTRLLAFDGDMASSAEEKKLWAIAEQLVPAKGVEAYTQGLMDLGATVCTPRKPQCLICPASALCAGTAEAERYPVKSRKLKRSRRENWWLWLEREGRVLLQQRPGKGVWAGLWSLPMFEDEAALRACAGSAEMESMPRIEHALTHFDWVLHTRRVQNPIAAASLPEGEWVAREELARYALPAPLKKLINP
ncbi:MAG: A/G-specific adenine glycosylase [Paucibacter sp.]|nr:A/G-specific adenine glycosylase [Roseateles sp.]